MPPRFLFNKHNIFDVLKGQEQHVRKLIQDLPANKLLSASEQDLIAALVEDCQLNVPVLKEPYVADSGEQEVDVPLQAIYGGWRAVPGTRIVIAIPFEGEPQFFDIQPQTFGSELPQAEVENGEIRLTYLRYDHDTEALKRDFERALSTIQKNLSSLAESARTFNSQLEELVAPLLQQRKQKLLRDAGMVAALGLPLKKRAGMPVTYSVPIKRRVPKIEQIKVEGAFKPEPALSQGDYEEILRIMKNMAIVMERSPRAFVDMGEEMLRWHFLVQLNGVYEGQATGETFNFQGKTDVLVRVEDKNVFIAECKFWDGEKAFHDTLDQLLQRYLSWRDTKAAVVVFNTKKNFDSVLNKIAEEVPKHPHFKRDLGKSDETTFRYVFAQPNEPSREITLTVLAFADV
jgi:hypothetical protein